jgi:hypothetical protein
VDVTDSTFDLAQHLAGLPDMPVILVLEGIGHPVRLAISGPHSYMLVAGLEQVELSDTDLEAIVAAG